MTDYAGKKGAATDGGESKPAPKDAAKDTPKDTPAKEPKESKNKKAVKE